MPKIVTLAYDANLGQATGIYSGVTGYIREAQLDWHIIPLNYAFESRLIDLIEAGRLDGAIGTFVSDRWVSRLTENGVAAVNLFNFSEIRSIPRVCVDDRGIGFAAAKHFQEYGTRSVTFLCRERTYQNSLRLHGLKGAKRSEAFFEVDWLGTRAECLESIKAAPKPVGILCSSDRIARELIHELELSGLKTGKDVLVIGVGNDPAESLFAGIPISSFNIPSQAIGRIAAQLLAEQINPKSASVGKPVQSLRAELLARASSLPTRHSRLATKALRLAEEQIANANFNIAEMARQLGASRRSLELAVRKEFKQSPYQLLTKIRLDHASMLLRKSQMPIGEVGQQCGYPEPHHFSAWFKQHRGSAPRQYRQSERSIL